MSKTSKIILVTIVATCILLGLGYAAITNITLNIAGTASATADSGNFKVRFTENVSVSESAYVTATRTGDHTATIAVSGLTSAGQSVTATYEIKNESSDLSADLSVDTSNDNTEYFKISSQLAKSSLTANETTTVLVTVELTKTPIDEDVSANVGVSLTAMPVQPGEEGTSVGTNDYSETPTTLNEYGFYFDEAYTFTDSDGIEWAAIPHADGSAEMLYNGVFLDYEPAGGLTYEKNIINYGSSIITITDSGRQFVWAGDTYILNESYMDKYDIVNTNQYGFAFEQAYSFMDFSSGTPRVISEIFYEDGSAEIYIDGKYYELVSENTMIYGNGTMQKGEDAEVASILENGRVIYAEDGSLGYDPTFFDRYGLGDNNYYGVTTDEGKTYRWIKTMPTTTNLLDVFLEGDYSYLCNTDEWLVMLSANDDDRYPEEYICSSRDKETYGPIRESICNIPVGTLSYTFQECTNLKVAPEIPKYVTSLVSAFDGCTSLTSAPTKSSSVTLINHAFAGCTALTGNVVINVQSLEYSGGCFDGVDMRNITLTGTAPKDVLNELGATGENYTPIP